jgi:hypothetical protein
MVDHVLQDLFELSDRPRSRQVKSSVVTHWGTLAWTPWIAIWARWSRFSTGLRARTGGYRDRFNALQSRKFWMHDKPARANVHVLDGS